MKEEEKRKLTLEDYVCFLNNIDRPRLTLNQLNQIVFMHGFIRFRTKKEILPNLRGYDLMRPTRSTVSERGVTSCAALELQEVKDDIAAIGWQECPIGSLSSVRLLSQATVAPTAAAAAPEAVSISSVSAASHLGRIDAATTSSGGKKRKRAPKTRSLLSLPAN